MTEHLTVRTVDVRLEPCSDGGYEVYNEADDLLGVVRKSGYEWLIWDGWGMPFHQKFDSRRSAIAALTMED